MHLYIFHDFAISEASLVAAPSRCASRDTGPELSKTVLTLPSWLFLQSVLKRKLSKMSFLDARLPKSERVAIEGYCSVANIFLHLSRRCGVKDIFSALTHRSSNRSAIARRTVLYVDFHVHSARWVDLQKSCGEQRQKMGQEILLVPSCGKIHGERLCSILEVVLCSAHLREQVKCNHQTWEHNHAT